MRPGPMTLQNLKKIKPKFDAMFLLSVELGKEIKPASVKTEEIIALVVEEATVESTHGTFCRTSNGRMMEYSIQNCP